MVKICRVIQIKTEPAGWRVRRRERVRASDLRQLDDESAADVAFEAVAVELPDPDVVGELDVIVLGQHAASVALERARLDDVRDLGDAQRALQLLVGGHVERVVARDAQRVHRLVSVVQQLHAEQPDRLPAEPLEHVQPLVGRLVVVARHDAVTVAADRAVAQDERRERPVPGPRLCGGATSSTK